MKQKLFPIFLSLLFVLPQMIHVSRAQTCTNRFVEHVLPHVTQTYRQPVQFYESNGSGVGINDLNNDGLLDIVLGNLKGSNTILWNTGNLEFRAESFARNSRTRMVAIVDVDADGWQDIVLTTQLGAPSIWHNNGDETFSFSTLDGVNHPAYTLDWGDVDADGDLDLVTASYDAELFQLLRDNFLFNGGAGVYFYENDQEVYVENRLSDKAQALAVLLMDINDDDTPELIVGNDFSLPDQSWSFQEGSWKSYDAFAVTTFSTMSFDVGDIDNDGSRELFAADMHPAIEDSVTANSWRYVLEDIASAARLPGDRQIPENVMHMRTADGKFMNAAGQYGIAATGWTWAAKFGDLDQDGYLDLYAVNGMQSVELFPHLPDDALIEPNAAFRNEAGERFVLMPEWGLGSLQGGRGMSMGDLDNDGDLDIIINNLNTVSMLYENDLCGGSSLQVDLRWPGSANPYGIGSKLALHTSAGTYYRDLRATSGYLSGDPSRVHLGFPSEAALLWLEIEWPDHQVTRVEDFSSDLFITITR